ncbi:hypothetical protein AAFF_G00042970 [Aldrovandia affinis]|uniref:Gypsy retrotransposon integrase-like protein 1 n=1 Tax=Aldrovandia affinis TaxID=143900 RepID=A0AAD7S2E2_9TELE|nr:hypothetical protein AAFF_G00042970 [Aldrovandia affinis]
MAAMGVIEPSSSPWAAPAVLVWKKNGEWRFCADYRRLNAVTRKDAYPLPRIDEALDHIAGSSWFCLLDLRSGYWQAGLRLNPRKCQLLRKEMAFLGHVVSERGVATDPAKSGRAKLLRDPQRAAGSGESTEALRPGHFRLRTDHALLTWLLNFKHPEGQVARWLEELQECNFQIKHRAGRHHTNADALSRRPCAELDCRHCHRQEEKSQVEPEVAAVHTISEAGWLPVSPEQLRKGQEADGMLQKVRGWLEAGRPPQWAEVSAEGPELKAYYGQCRSLELWDGLAYRRWQAPRLGSDLLQLLVPQALRPQVLGLVHGSEGAGHFGNSKTLQRLRGRFYWPGCHWDVELHSDQGRNFESDDATPSPE